MENVQSKPSERYFSIDLIRTLAIVMVVLVHSSGFPYRIQGEITSTVVLDWFTADVSAAIGFLGVPLFVMLSGAMLLEPAKADEPLGVYFRKRFDRIAFPMMFWTVVYFAWDYFIHGKPLTLYSVSQGLSSGSYGHLWFLYLLLGLYLLTPVLRVLIKHIDRKRFTFLLSVWFVGTISTPAIHTFTSLSYNPLTFLFLDWLGYFLLGIFLLYTKVRSWILYAALTLGLLGAILGEWFLTAMYGEQYAGFFHGYLSFNMIIASAALFMILLAIPKEKIESRYPIVNRVIHWIGQNTLPIYLVHVIVLETLQFGLLGFTLIDKNNLIVEIPLATFVAFSLSVAIIYPLKKIPYVKKLIG